MAANTRPDQGVKINVICRCRPPTVQERTAKHQKLIETNEAGSEVSIFQSVAGKQIDRTYKFDKVFGPRSTQATVYHGAISPIVKEVMEGFNCTVFAYGQTGTGKTYTMEGGDRKSIDGVDLSEAAGVIPRAIKEIFEDLEANALEYSVKVSFMELYNEELTDLLSVSDAKLKLMESGTGIVVHGIEENIVRNAAEIFAVLDRGSAKRRTAETLLNKVSSRSHSIFTITIHMKECTPEGDEVIKVGKLNLVDLAGSENISRSGAKDDRAREAGNINQSLLTLGRVINALVEHQGHVPYRDSKLTRLLRDSLGGKTKTCIIATIAPSVTCQDETVSTLDYAHRAKNIRNKPEINQRISKSAHIKDLSIEIDKIKAELNASREKNGVYLPFDEFKRMEMDIASKERNIEELQAELGETKQDLQTMTEELTILSDEYESTLIELEETQSELSKTTDALLQAREHIEERDHLIEAHLNSESVLATHAENLTDELSRTADELGGAFQKIERKRALEEENLQVVARLQTESSKQLTSLEQEIGRNQGIQQGFHADIQGQIDSFEARSAAEVAELRSKVEGLTEIFLHLQASASSLVNSQAEAASDSIKGLGVMHSSYSSAAAEAAESAALEAKRAMDALLESIREQKGELQAFAERQIAVSEGFLSATKQMAQGACAAATSIQSQAETTKTKSFANSASQAQALTKFQEKFKASMAADSNALMAKISSLLGDFVQSKHAMLDEAMESSRTQIVFGASGIGSCSDSIFAAATGQIDGLNTAVADAAAACADYVKAVKDSEGSMQSALHAVHDGIEQLNSNVHAETNRAADALKQHTEMLNGHVAAGVEGMQNHVSKAVSELEGHGSDGAAAKAALSASIDAVEVADKEFASDLRSVASTCSEHINSFCDAAGTDVSGLSVTIQTATAAIKEDEPTACTPRKRDLQVPARELVASLRTPAHDVVLSEFRTRKKTAAGNDKENISNGVLEVHVKMDAAVAAPLQPAA